MAIREWMDLKTGTTDYAGYCFTGTAKRDGKDLSPLSKMQQMQVETAAIKPVLMKQEK